MTLTFVKSQKSKILVLFNGYLQTYIKNMIKKLWSIAWSITFWKYLIKIRANRYTRECIKLFLIKHFYLFIPYTFISKFRFCSNLYADSVQLL